MQKTVIILLRVHYLKILFGIIAQNKSNKNNKSTKKHQQGNDPTNNPLNKSTLPQLAVHSSSGFFPLLINQALFFFLLTYLRSGVQFEGILRSRIGLSFKQYNFDLRCLLSPFFKKDSWINYHLLLCTSYTLTDFISG